MPAKILSTLDTSNKDTIDINFVSLSDNGITSEEKLLVSKMINIMSRAKGFPKIESLETGTNE